MPNYRECSGVDATIQIFPPPRKLFGKTRAGLCFPSITYELLTRLNDLQRFSKDIWSQYLKRSLEGNKLFRQCSLPSKIFAVLSIYGNHNRPPCPLLAVFENTFCLYNIPVPMKQAKDRSENRNLSNSSPFSAMRAVRWVQNCESWVKDLSRRACKIIFTLIKTS